MQSRWLRQQERLTKIKGFMAEKATTLHSFFAATAQLHDMKIA